MASAGNCDRQPGQHLVGRHQPHGFHFALCERQAVERIGVWRPNALDRRGMANGHIERPQSGPLEAVFARGQRLAELLLAERRLDRNLPVTRAAGPALVLRILEHFSGPRRQSGTARERPHHDMGAEHHPHGSIPVPNSRSAPAPAARLVRATSATPRSPGISPRLTSAHCSSHSMDLSFSWSKTSARVA